MKSFGYYTAHDADRVDQSVKKYFKRKLAKECGAAYDEHHKLNLQTIGEVAGIKQSLHLY